MDSSLPKSKGGIHTHCFPEIKSKDFEKDGDSRASNQFKQSHANVKNENKTSQSWLKTDHPNSESELKRLIAEAHEQGYSNGFKDGQAEESKRIDKLADCISKAFSELEIFKAKLLKYSEESVVKLVLAIARKVIIRELVISSDVILSITHNALKMLVDPHYAKIRVNPKDFEILNANIEKISTIIGKSVPVQIESDANILSGGCVIETDFGDIDARIDVQLQIIEKALMHEMSLIAQNKQGE